MNRDGQAPGRRAERLLVAVDVPGSVGLPADSVDSKARVRLRNDGGKQIARGELHFAYHVKDPDATEVTFAWTDGSGDHTASQRFSNEDTWKVPTGRA